VRRKEEKVLALQRREPGVSVDRVNLAAANDPLMLSASFRIDVTWESRYGLENSSCSESKKKSVIHILIKERKKDGGDC
jgi:hypothetical protein